MRFDPKLIHPDEPPLNHGGDLDLPADLAALGEQLSADAAQLAATYSAGRTPGSSSVRQARPRPVWRYARYVAASAAALTALWIAAAAWQPARRPLAQTAPAKTPVMSPTTTSPVAVNSPRPAGPTVSLTDLSGPELEAVLDMLESDSAREASISF